MTEKWTRFIQTHSSSKRTICWIWITFLSEHKTIRNNYRSLSIFHLMFSCVWQYQDTKRFNLQNRFGFKFSRFWSNPGSAGSCDRRVDESCWPGITSHIRTVVIMFCLMHADVFTIEGLGLGSQLLQVGQAQITSRFSKLLHVQETRHLRTRRRKVQEVLKSTFWV